MFVRLLLILFVLWYTAIANAKDHVRLPNVMGSSDPLAYQFELTAIKAALEATVADFGEYEVSHHPRFMPRARLLKELASGNLVNVAPAPTRTEWEDQVTPIYFPLRKGTLGFRIFLIHKNSKALFSKIDSIASLKKLSAGQDYSWSSGIRMRSLGFQIYSDTSVKRFYDMLNHARYDYYPKAIYEARRDAKKIALSHPNIIVEETKMLLLFQPLYIFVSPGEERLTKRMRTGIWRIHHNGVFDKIFANFHDIKQMKKDVEKRQILNTISPQDLFKHPAFTDPNLWFYGWPESTAPHL